jgi:hypothetical protein
MMKVISYFFIFRVMEHRWNEIDLGEKNLSQCHCVQNKSHVDWTGIETALPRWEARRLTALSYGTAQSTVSLVSSAFHHVIVMYPYLASAFMYSL